MLKLRIEAAYQLEIAATALSAIQANLRVRSFSVSSLGQSTNPLSSRKASDPHEMAVA